MKIFICAVKILIIQICIQLKWKSSIRHALQPTPWRQDGRTHLIIFSQIVLINLSELLYFIALLQLFGCVFKYENVRIGGHTWQLNSSIKRHSLWEIESEIFLSTELWNEFPVIQGGNKNYSINK